MVKSFGQFPFLKRGWQILVNQLILKESGGSSDFGESCDFDEYIQSDRRRIY